MFNKKILAFLKVGVFLALSVLILGRIGYSQLVTETGVAILQGIINIQPVKPLLDDSKKIQPGTPVKFTMTLENKGKEPSPEGELYIRYAFTKPLDKQPNSIIFETEKLPVKAIEPGKKVDVDFTSTHLLPSVFDFVRYDWPMREYQAVFVVDHAEKVIGNVAMIFSAYYYPGLKHEIPAEFPVTIERE